MNPHRFIPTTMKSHETYATDCDLLVGRTSFSREEMMIFDHELWFILVLISSVLFQDKK